MPRSFFVSNFSINRNILECKFQNIVACCHGSGLVLIETYWNVNAVANVLSGLPDLVLIETYWNVNEDRSGISREQISY